MRPVSSFAAKQPDLRLEKRVNLFTEGEKTEPAYFNHLNKILGPAYMHPIHLVFKVAIIITHKLIGRKVEVIRF